MSFPSWSPDGQQLAWLRFLDGRASLVTRGLFDGAVTTIAEWRGQRLAGLSWAPDGQNFVVSVSGQVGVRPGALSIVILNAATGEARSLTTPPVTSGGDVMPAWSPSGDRVAFVRAVGVGVSDLFVVDVESQKEERLSRLASKIPGLSWTGEHGLLFLRFEVAGGRVWRYNFETRQIEPLDIRGSQSPIRIAAGGSRLLLVESDGNSDLRLAGTPARNGQAIAQSTAWDGQPSISQSGRLAFASARSGNTEIWWATDLDSEPVRRTDFAGPLSFHPRWSPDGRLLVFDSRPEGQSDIFVASALSTETPRALTKHTAEDLFATFSLSGELVYFASDRSGTWQIWSIAIDGEAEPRQITQNGGQRSMVDPVTGDLFFDRPQAPGLWRLPLPDDGEPAPGSAAERVKGVPADEHSIGWDLDETRIVLARSDGSWLEIDRQTDAIATRFGDVRSIGDFALWPSGGIVYRTQQFRERDLLVVELLAKSGRPKGSRLDSLRTSVAALAKGISGL